jgi:hypothetical protein
MAVLLAAFGCGDDTNMTTPTQDLSVPIVKDMSVTFGTKNCLQVITCAAGCAGASACIANCASMGTQQAQTKYQALAVCALSGCTSAPDGGGTPACTSATDSSQKCTDCVTAFGQSPTCATQLATCESDM